MMLRVALVSSHQGSELNCFLEPVSLLWLAAFLEARSVTTEVIVGEVHEIARRLKVFSPDVVAMSSYWNSDYEGLGREIKKSFPGVILAVGGPDITGRMIEGERNDGNTFDTWFKGCTFKAFSDLMGQTMSWPLMVEGTLDEPPIGQWPRAKRLPELIRASNFRGRPAGRQEKGGGWAFLSSSVGCPHACRFCLNAAMNNCQVEFRDPAEVADEAQQLAELGAGMLHMTDEDVSYSFDHLSRLCQEFRKVGLKERLGILAGVGVRSMMSRPEDETKAILREMREAGFVQLGIGVEAEEPSRAYLKGKSFPKDDEIRAWARLCDEAGIRSLGLTLAGPWWQTEEQMVKAIASLNSLGLDTLQCSELLAFPGTRISKGINVDGKLILPDRKTLLFPSKIPNMLAKARNQMTAHYESPEYQSRVAAKAARWPGLM